MSYALANDIPGLRYNAAATRTWASVGNTDTVTDTNVTTSSVIVINNTSAFNGRWQVSVAAGSFTVTSSASESAATTYSYRIL